MEGNPLEALPKSLLELPLHTLDLGYWTNLPDWFSQLQHLETLILTVDELVIFPTVITNLPALKSLVLKGWLTAQSQTLLPDLLSKIPALKIKHLSLIEGPIEYLGEDLSPFEQLETLDLKDQPLGEIERARIIGVYPRARDHRGLPLQRKKIPQKRIIL